MPLFTSDAVDASFKDHRIEIVVTADQVTIDGQSTLIDELDTAIPERLSITAELRERLLEEKAPWLLTVAADVPFSRALAALDALAASNETSGLLAFSTKPAAPFPGPPDADQLKKLAAELDEAPTDQQAVILAKKTKAAIPSACDGIKRAFEAVAAADPRMRCKLLANGIAEGLRECGCENEKELVTLTYAITVGVTQPTLEEAHVPITLDPQAPAIERGSDEPWGRVIASVPEADLQRLHFKSNR